MRSLTAVALSLVLSLTAAQAYADSHDTTALVCQRDFLKGGASPIYQGNWVANYSATSAVNVVCPVVLSQGTNRQMTISGHNFSCTAYGWDINLNTVTMPSVTLTTDTSSADTLGSFTIPDSVAKLVIACTISPSRADNVFLSLINDFDVTN